MVRWLLTVIPVSLLVSTVFLQAQSPAGANPSAGQSGFTLQANTRVVLTDVTVTDKSGRPVEGLKAEDFRILDNKKPQEIASFEEHRRDNAAPWVQSAAAPGVYSNEYVARPPGVLNVVLIDITNLSIEDQMYLNYQIGKFLDALKPEQPIALYARTGPACILLQGFTSDRALLRAAVRKVLPRFPPPGREYLSDFQALQQIEVYLAAIPGRKNVLWFSGGSTLFLRPDATQFENYRQWQEVYDDLEANRIAVYPIDARGLTTYGSPTLLSQHGVMHDVAEATGGRALYDNNGLAQFASDIVDRDGDYYTLTYSPRDFKYDNKWHKVSMRVSGGEYMLSYRRGYFGDVGMQKKQSDRTRTRLLASGKTEEAAPSNNKPILFQAKVSAGAMADAAASPARESPKTDAESHGGMTPFTVHYSLPLEAFQLERVDGRWKVLCGAAVLAFNSDGTLLSKKAQQTTFTLKDEAAQQPAGKVLPLDEEIHLAKGDVYLYVAVWDMRTMRLGSLEIPFHVAVKSEHSQSLK